MPKGKKAKVQGGIFIAKDQNSRRTRSKFPVSSWDAEGEIPV